jgi:16S rRNA (guanine1207-N2)-methyltransferase
MGPQRPHFGIITLMTIPELKSDIIFTADLKGLPMVFHSTWGLFSPKAIDEGTQLLLNYVDVEPASHILDLGCGYGPLGLTLAKLAPQGEVQLVDKDFTAVEYSLKNAQANNLDNVKAYLSNGFSNVPAGDRSFRQLR